MRFQVTNRTARTSHTPCTGIVLPGPEDFPCLRGGTGGFTLIDNLLTLIVLMFTMLALIGLLGAVISANATNKKHTMAIGLVEGKIAEIRRQGYNSGLGADSTLTEGYNATGPPASPLMTLEPYRPFKRVTVIKINNPAAGMQTVTVTVYWDQDRRSVSKSAVLAQ